MSNLLEEALVAPQRQLILGARPHDGWIESWRLTGVPWLMCGVTLPIVLQRSRSAKQASEG